MVRLLNKQGINAAITAEVLFAAPNSYNIWKWFVLDSKELCCVHSRVAEELFSWYEVYFLPVVGFYVVLLLMNTKCGSTR